MVTSHLAPVALGKRPAAHFRPPNTMKLSAKTEYACLAMLELAAHWGAAEPLRIRDIAEPHGIPARFLVQILLQLKGAGLVVSTRGASGGYQLARSPEAISLGEVLAVIDGQEADALAGGRDASPTARVLQQFWREVAEVEREMLSSTTLGDLVERARRQAQHMYYI
jgi:Rrf2 family protein